MFVLFFLMIRPPPTSTLFPYTTLFRSQPQQLTRAQGALLKIVRDNTEHFKDVSVAERSEEHTSELQSRGHLVCRLLLEKKKTSRHPGALSAAELRPDSCLRPADGAGSP